MKRNKSTFLIVLLLTGAVTFSSCIGSFRLSNRLLSWNKTIGGKFVNELVFLCFWILPVYEVCLIADVLVLNSIEFWRGSNPVASNKVQKITGENADYIVRQNADGYHVTNLTDNTEVDLRFSEETQTWSVEANGVSTPFMTFIDDNNVRMYMPDGTTMDVPISESGVVAFKNVVENNSAYSAAFQ